MGHLAQLPVELDEPCEEIVEAAANELAVAVEHERVDLVAQLTRLRAEREYVLNGPVVQVEAETREPVLGVARERALTSRIVLEQQLALEHGRERQGGFVEVRADIASAVTVEARDDGCSRNPEAVHRRGAEG